MLLSYDGTLYEISIFFNKYLCCIPVQCNIKVRVAWDAKAVANRINTFRELPDVLRSSVSPQSVILILVTRLKSGSGFDQHAETSK